MAVGVLDFLSRILGEGQSQNRLMQAAQGPNSADRFGWVLSPRTQAAPDMAGQQGIGAYQLPGLEPEQSGPPSIGSYASPSQPRSAPKVEQPSGGGFGNFVQKLFDPNAEARNVTVDWLQKKGYSPNDARLITANKPMLQAIINDHYKSRQPSEFDQRAAAAQRYGLTGEQLRTFALTGDLPSGPSQDWSKMDDGRLFNQRTGEIREVGAPESDGPFSGNSVEAQALNGMVKSGRLTLEQAQDLAAGKVITNPEDGSMIFMTPQGLVSRPSPEQPVQPTPNQPQTSNPPAQPSVTSAPPSGTTPPQANAQPAVPTANTPAGAVQLTPGKPGKLASEDERKNRSLYHVVQPELKVVEDNWPALSAMKDQMAGGLPYSEFVTTPEYQTAKSSLMTIVSSYMYSVSGAQAPPAEVEATSSTLLPKPGESDMSKANKRRRIRTMVEAIKLRGGEPDNVTPTQPADGVIDWKDWVKTK